MKKELSKKLIAYSGLAATAILNAKLSNAQLVYNDIDDIIINEFNPSYYLDLNNDGVSDYHLSYHHIEGFNLIGFDVYCSCFDNQFVQTSSSRLIKISSGEELCPILTEPDWYWLAGWFSTFKPLLAYGTSSSGGAWMGGGTGLVGLRFKIDDVYHNGWARFSVTANARKMILQDYAYQSDPAGCIIAGDQGCTENYEPNNFKLQAAPIPVNTAINAAISSATDDDFFSFPVSLPDNNIRIVLSGNPVNYNIKLIDQGGNLLAKSTNKGTNNDTIIYNNLAPGNYYVKVFTRNGNFIPLDCYKLKVEANDNPFRESLISTAEDNLELNVFPNPISDFATIQFSIENHSAVTLNLFDLQGRKIKTIAEGSFSAGNHQLSIKNENLSAGVYLLRLQTEDGMSTMKIVIE